MWAIELVDIEGNGLVVDFTTSVDTLVEAELIAKSEIEQQLGTNGLELVHSEDLIYDVWDAEKDIGVVHIRSL